MTNPLTAKLLALGLSGLLGGAGLALGPEITPEIVNAAANVDAIETVELPEPVAAYLEDEGIESLKDLEPMMGAMAEDDVSAERREAAHARRDARAEAREARLAARAEAREARRAEHAETREARRAILDARPAPGEGRRGLSAEAREAMRELRRGGPDRAERAERAERGAPDHAHGGERGRSAMARGHR